MFCWWQFVGDNTNKGRKLKAFFKPGVELITLKGAGRAYMDRNADYLEGLKRALQ